MTIVYEVDSPNEKSSFIVSEKSIKNTSKTSAAVVISTLKVHISCELSFR